MASNKYNFFNLLVVGPDMLPGHRPTKKPDYNTPDPGPDSDYYGIIGPGYKLGSYLNVYNFDHEINRILGCNDWSTFLQPKTREVWDAGCMVEEVVGQEDFLSIDSPENNNIPKNVYILIQRGMIKGDAPPELSSWQKTNIFSYEATGNEEDRYRGWWISDELKSVLEEVYGWKFFEDVLLENNTPRPPEEVFTDNTWNGGVEKFFGDIEYHSLKLALDDKYNLGGDDDNRAMGDRIDVVALFSYAVGRESIESLRGARATLTGDCDSGYFAEIKWNRVVPSNPDLVVDKYKITLKNNLDEPVHLTDFHVADPNQEEYVWSHDLSTLEVGDKPKYFISWQATDGSQSAESYVSKAPGGFALFGVPSCEGLNVVLEKTFSGDCWTERYGEVELKWDISLPENTSISSLTFIKDGQRIPLETDVRSFIDQGVEYVDSEYDVNYSVEVETTSFSSSGASNTITSDPVIHSVEECVCDDDGLNACVDKCWVREGTSPDVIVWMENYIEQPFSDTPYASFDINYCIADQCSLGVEDFSARLKLPEGFKIVAAESEHGQISYEADFQIGMKKDEWIIQPDEVAGDWQNARPTHGTLCTVRINKPIGTHRIKFIINDDERSDTKGSTVVIDSTTYDWDNNTQNPESSYNSWQAGPPLSVCTDEIDMGYGDYLLDVQAIDLQTFDVNFCLSRDDFDTFILVVMNTDFKTQVSEVDPVIGLAANAGWDITHQSISPGMSIIMGNGTNAISSSGYDTLLRAKLDSAAIKKENLTPEQRAELMLMLSQAEESLESIEEQYASCQSTDGDCTAYEVQINILNAQIEQYELMLDNETCVCVFPFFFKLDGLWENVKSIAGSYLAGRNQLQSQSTGVAYHTQPVTMAVAAASPMLYAPQNNMLVQGLTNIANNIDPRFKEIVQCIADAYKVFLGKINNPDSASQYTAEEAMRIGVSIQLFMAMISVFSTISIAKSDKINQQLDNIAELGNSLCNNYLKADISQPSDGDGTVYDIDIKYSFPTGEVAGVQFHMNIPDEFVLDKAGLVGDAKTQKYLQCMGSDGGYLCVYDYALDKKPSQGFSALTTMGRNTDDPEPTLTSFKLLYTGDGTPPTVADLTAMVGILDSGEGIIPAKLVTNSVRVDPSEKWNGDWYNVDQQEEVNTRDFLVACILCSGTEADLMNPDGVIVLPGDESVTVKYFGGTSYDLSNITYDPNTWIGRDGENFQEYVLDFFDANGDGVADVSDVVTIRNMFTVIGSTAISRKRATNIKNIVPTEMCSIGQGRLDFEFYVPDECSDFCIRPSCFSKIWISDVIPVSSQGAVDEVFLEVSYAADCDSASLSGVEFSLRGLIGDGILSCVNGGDGEITALREYDWDFHIVPATRYSKTKSKVVAHATSGNGYIPAGAGVLTYLKLNSSSIYGLNTATEAYKAFTHTNTYALNTTSPSMMKLVGASGGSAMEPLYATHQNTPELLSYRRFGVKVSSFRMTSNDSLNAASEEFEINEVDPSFSISLIASNAYKASYDADGEGTINLIDVQAAYHAKNLEKFETTEDALVPIECCPCDAPGDFKFITGDFLTTNASGENELTLDKASGWLKSNSISLKNLKCGGRYEGGVVLAWTPSEDAKYYIVYRIKAGTKERPVPVIGSKVGVIANSVEFKDQIDNSRNSARARHPEQIDSTIWIDFPPASSSSCCDWCPDGSCEDEKVSETYEYYVVAHNECGETASNSSNASTPCCEFPPVAMDDYIAVEANVDNKKRKSYSGRFSVKTKSGDSNVYTFTTTSGSVDQTEKGGRFEVYGGPPYTPSEKNPGKPNSFAYKYTPPVGFFGLDKIKYVAVEESKSRGNWGDWCDDTATITIFVYPPNPRASGYSGDCANGEERGGAILKWERIPNVVKYKIYRDEELIDEVLQDEAGYYLDTELAEELQESCSDSIILSYAIVPVFLFEGKEISPEAQPFEVKIECCGEVENPDIIARIEKDICDEDNNTQMGSVFLFWSDLGAFDEYNLYRRGGYSTEDPETLDWNLINTIVGAPDQDGYMKVFDNSVVGCYGCGVVKYDYCVTSITSAGEGEVGQNTVTVEFDCCQSEPIAKDQSFVLEDGESLINKRLWAFDANADIISYTLLSQPSVDSGTLFDFDTNTGEFSFLPAAAFYGETFFDWEVIDSCGNKDTARVTLVVEGGEYCNENDYIICNAALSYLTAQQDQLDIRIKDENVTQVPFSLNNKGVPSLRKRCGAYSVTQGIDPSLFALPEGGCYYFKFSEFDDPLIIPDVSLSCEDEAFFNECVGLGLGDSIPAVTINCVDEVDFSECKPVLSGETIPDAEMEHEEDN